MVAPLKPTTDRVTDILRSGYCPLKEIFCPESVAVVGASERLGSVGRTLLWNLISNPFGGTVYPVNPKRKSILGVKAYPSLSQIPEVPELVVIAIPAPGIPPLIEECVKIGVKGVIIISAGFKEIGPSGIKLEEDILAIAKGKLRIIGPNCLGVMNPHSGLNATFAKKNAQPGNVGFLSQSGAFCTSVLDWSLRENVGFSAFVSVGSMLDVDWGDLIYYLGDDPKTESIVIYMESIGNPKSFISAAREVALSKPIIIIKAGQTEEATQAAASHTGALTGSDKVLDAVFRRCGVLRVKRIEELFDMAELLGKRPQLPKSNRLTIVTNAGGPGVLATDALVVTGGKLAKISDETIAKLNEFLPSHWSHSNPIDILGDADPIRYAKTFENVIADPNSDGVLVILTPQAMTDPSRTAEELCKYAANGKKPVFASWMGGDDVTPGEQLLNKASIPTYPYPDEAARLFNLMYCYSYNLGGLYETPSITPSQVDMPNCNLVEHIFQEALSHNRVILTESESKQILGAYGLPIVETINAYDADTAVAKAEKIGYPVVLKLLSETITHKTDVGGVQLNLGTEKAVRWAFEEIKQSVTAKVGSEHFMGVTVQPMLNIDGSYELIVGSSIDPQFGPVLLFGTGGQLVEVFKDQAIALPPLNSSLARRLMEQTTIHRALQGVRGRKAVDLEALEQLLVAFSQLVTDNPRIKEIDINPLLVSPERIISLDARIVLHPPELANEDLPRTTIRPYPQQYTSHFQLKNQTDVTIRPIRPEDEPAVIKFHETLSQESVYFRYFHMIKLAQLNTHERLTRMCFIDYDREMAVVVMNQAQDIIGIGRLSKLHGINEAEFALMIADSYQCQGIGTKVLETMVTIARNEKIERITAEVLRDNGAMQRVFQKNGFTIKKSSDIVHACLEL